MGLGNAAAAALAGMLSMSGVTSAAEITILTSQGVNSAVQDLAPAFERATGHKVIVSFVSTPAFNQMVNSNAPADLIAQGPDVVDDLIGKGKVAAGSRVDFARAGVGVAVKAGAPKPDIGTVEAFRRAMLDAKSIAYARTGYSGVHAAKVMERLGIADAIKGKVKLVDGVPVAKIVAEGGAEVGLQQINVILPVAGADYVGPLPAELQGYVPFAMGMLTVAKEPAVAKAFMQFAAAPENAALLRKSGMEPIAP
jgi:molybdate transport system substrate-binding protein